MKHSENKRKLSIT